MASVRLVPPHKPIGPWHASSTLPGNQKPEYSIRASKRAQKAPQDSLNLRGRIAPASAKAQ